TDLWGRRPREYEDQLDRTRVSMESWPESIQAVRRYCPDVLVEVLLHVQSAFNADVLLAEYVFMTRPFSALPTNVLKVVDTHDVHSMKQAKMAQYGIQRSGALSADFEAELLNRSDLVVAIQDGDADALRALAPTRSVITVGIDFTTVETAQRPSTA